MINEKKHFESLTAFYILLGILILLIVISIARCVMGGNYGDITGKAEIRNEPQGLSGKFEENMTVDSNGLPYRERYDQEALGEEYVYGIGGEKSVEEDGEESGYKYEIAAEEGVINVYMLGENGERTFYRQTSIPYELLSENDREMMDYGIFVYTDEALESILQDFES